MEPDDVDPETRVRLIGDPVDYADGSEGRVLDVLRRASDLRTASDELAAGIVDWPSRYHLSRLRANLLRPLDIGPGMRVLDAGAGTGALTRHLAETGARVVAVEGTLLRAQATAARCRDLDNVEVLCGRLDDYADEAGHDVVVCVGLLEYAGNATAELLARFRALTRPEGVLVLAIENQLGVRYLLGYEEDHLREPWVGVEGYPGDPHVRTFTRRRLGATLADAGFGAQRWLFPFPDYKLPTAIVGERAYLQPDGGTFVDQIVGWPSSDAASPPTRVCDDRAAHRVFLDAGLGMDVANSFLVVAGGDEAAVGRLVPPDVDAWFFGRERLRIWSRYKRFTLGSPPTVESRPVEAREGPRERAWLSQESTDRNAVVEGPTVEQLALAALRVGPDALGGVLLEWSDHLRLLETKAADDTSVAATHPFRSPGTEWLLPADHVDIGLSNFIVDARGALRFVDDEWRAAGPVDAVLVRTRALWWFAAGVVQHGVAHPWPPGTTVDALASAMGALCETSIDVADLYSWRLAEADLQHMVAGRPPEQTNALLTGIGESSHLSAGNLEGLPFTVLRAQVTSLSSALSAGEEALSRERADARTLGDQVAGLTGHVGVLESALAAERELRRQLTVELEEARARRGAFERRPLVRLYRRLQRLPGRR